MRLKIRCIQCGYTVEGKYLRGTTAKVSDYESFAKTFGFTEDFDGYICRNCKNAEQAALAAKKEEVAG